jgi:hypothetical protein
MGRRQSAPRRQNTLEHGILNDGSLSLRHLLSTFPTIRLYFRVYINILQDRSLHVPYTSRRYNKSEPITTYQQC